ncbi:helicase HerA-like domain-containing protein, partial [Streptomyces sp. NPDC005921]
MPAAYGTWPQAAQTVRLIRSKGVGVFFVTQTPKDVP